MEKLLVLETNLGKMPTRTGRKIFESSTLPALTWGPKLGYRRDTKLKISTHQDSNGALTIRN